MCNTLKNQKEGSIITCGDGWLSSSAELMNGQKKEGEHEEKGIIIIRSLGKIKKKRETESSHEVEREKSSRSRRNKRAKLMKRIS
jgi:hypothetical protein